MNRTAPASARWAKLLAAVAITLPALFAPEYAQVGQAAAATHSAEPQTSVSDVEDEVMCPICGTLLELAQSPQAQRERAFIARQVAAGRTKAEIKDALATQYGEEVLALPRGSGFDLSAYLVPAIAFAVAAVALATGVRRWRRAGRPGSSGPPATTGPDSEDGDRLDDDLARYDL